MTPILPNPETLAGRWSIGEQDTSAGCALVFTLRPVGNARAVEHDARCLAALGLSEVVAWRSTSDGIALIRPDGRTVTFFAREKDGYVLRRNRYPALLLTRSD